MWVFTRFGFYSVACVRTAATMGKPSRVDPGTIMVRARSEKHLDNLLKEFPVLAGLGVSETEDADYRYRIVMTRATWLELADAIAKDIEYANFKNQCAADSDLTSTEYVNALHEIWGVMYGTQK